MAWQCSQLMSPTVKQKTGGWVEPGAGQVLFMTDDRNEEKNPTLAHPRTRAPERVVEAKLYIACRCS